MTSSDPSLIITWVFGKVQKRLRVLWLTTDIHTQNNFQLLLRLSQESRRRDCTFVSHHNGREYSRAHVNVYNGSIGHFRAPCPARSILSAVETQDCQLLWKASWSSSNPLAERIYESGTSAELHHRAKGDNHSYNYRCVRNDPNLGILSLTIIHWFCVCVFRYEKHDGSEKVFTCKKDCTWQSRNKCYFLLSAYKTFILHRMNIRLYRVQTKL